jgi:Mg2+ and Co2+ transporter CorA
MIRALLHHADGRLSEPGAAELPAALAEPGGLLWLDLAAEPPEVCEPILRDTFAFHPLAVEDALAESTAQAGRLELLPVRGAAFRSRQQPRSAAHP